MHKVPALHYTKGIRRGKNSHHHFMLKYRHCVSVCVRARARACVYVCVIWLPWLNVHQIANADTNRAQANAKIHADANWDKCRCEQGQIPILIRIRANTNRDMCRYQQGYVHV